MNLNKFFIKILLFTILLKIYSSNNCKEGCLKCSLGKDNKHACEICNIFLNFAMNDEGDCVERIIPNCLVPSVDKFPSLCFQCIKGHKLDYVAQKCVPLTQQEVIGNCSLYTFNGECKACSEDFYISENQCKRTEKVVPHCAHYSREGYCIICSTGYYLEPISEICMEFTSINNCQIHTHTKCKICNPGYIKTSNPIMHNSIGLVSMQVKVALWSSGINYLSAPNSPCVSFPDKYCKEYENKKEMFTCIECKEDYFLNESKQCEESLGKSIKGCLNYSKPNICEECNPSLFLNSNTCWPRTKLINCKSFKIDEDVCAECSGIQFFIDKGECVPRINLNILNCKILALERDSCEICKTSFILRKKDLACLSVIDNCVEYDEDIEGSPNKLLCKKCKDDFTPSIEKTACNKCAEGDTTDSCLNSGSERILEGMSGCEVHPENSTICLYCFNLYSLNTLDGSCVRITDPNCLENIKNEDSCKLCKKNTVRIKQATGNYVCETNTIYKPVDFCLGNSSSDPKDLCSQCPVNHLLITSDKFSLERILDNCEIQLVKQCHRCVFGFDLVENEEKNKMICKKSENQNSRCGQINLELFTSLSANSKLGENPLNCLKCRDKSAHFIFDFTCFDRSKDLGFTCKELSLESDDCDVCNEGFTKKSTFPKEPVCKKTPEGFQALPGCLVHDIKDVSRCAVCDVQFFLGSDFKCYDTMNGIFKEIFFVNSLDSIYSVYTNNLKNVVFQNFYKMYFSNLGNCEEGYFNGSHMLCIKCQKGYVSIATTYMFSFDPVKKGFFEDYHAYLCIEPQEFTSIHLKTNSNVSYIHTEDCQLYYYLSSYTTCIACKTKVNPTVSYVHFHFNSRNNISSKRIPIIESCTVTEKSEILQKRYWGLVFRGQFPTIKSSMSSYILYDSCPNENEHLIALISKELISNDPLCVFDDGPTPKKLYICHDFKDSPLVENCHVYGSFISTHPEIDYPTNAQCISCKPGYTAALKDINDERFISKCVLIENCDLTNPDINTWMNACQTCKPGKVHPSKFIYYNDFIDYSQCIDQPTPNCLNGADSKCIRCAIGFKLTTDGLCETLPLPENCDSHGYSNENFKHYSFFLFFHRYSYSMIEYFKSQNLKAHRLGKCGKCSEGYSHVGLSLNSNNEICTIKENTISAPEPDCLQKYIYDQSICVLCKKTFLLNDKYQCVDNSANKFPNCVFLKSVDEGYICAACQPNYHFDKFNSICMKFDNCVEYGHDHEKATCRFCKEGYMVDSKDLTKCVPIVIPGCVKFTSFLYCVKCVPDQILIMVKLKDKIYSYCIENIFSDIEFEGNTFLLHEQPSDFSVKFENFIMNNEMYFQHQVLMNPDSFTRQVCLPLLPRNCERLSTKGHFCEECKQHYSLDLTLMNCLPSRIDNCWKTNQENECMECYENYHLNGKTLCELDTPINCDQMDDSGVYCLKCSHDYFVKQGFCYPRKVISCKIFKVDQDLCEKCSKDQFINDSLKCEAVTNIVPQCLYYDSATRCSQCQPDFLLNQFGLSCQKITEPSCQKWTTPNSCSDCPLGQSIIEIFEDPSDSTISKNICKQVMDNCAEATEIKNQTQSDDGGTQESVNKYTCKKCSMNYYLSGDKKSCIKASNLIYKCEIQESESVCSLCLPYYAISSDKTRCISTLASYLSNCKTSDLSSSIFCSQCSDGFYLNSSNECVGCGGEGCSVCNPNDTDLCSLCGPCYYMTANMGCQKNTVYIPEMCKEEDTSRPTGGNTIHLAQNFIIVLLLASCLFN